jgi:hypothetical protein
VEEEKMIRFPWSKQPQPISPIWINRLLIVIIFIQAIALGFYFTQYQKLEKDLEAVIRYNDLLNLNNL